MAVNMAKDPIQFCALDSLNIMVVLMRLRLLYFLWLFDVSAFVSFSVEKFLKRNFVYVTIMYGFY